MDEDPEGIGSFPKIGHFMNIALNGLNHLQVFAANSLLIRRLSPDAEISMISMPMLTPPFEMSFFPIIVWQFVSLFWLMILVPLMVYLAYTLGRE